MVRQSSAITVMVMAVVLAACVGNKGQIGAVSKVNSSWQQLEDNEKAVLDRVLLPNTTMQLLAVEGSGIQLSNAKQQVVDQLEGSFEKLDLRAISGKASLFATIDVIDQRVVIGRVTPQDIKQIVTLPKVSYEVSGVCLYQNTYGETYAFVVSERGLGSQWLLGDADQLAEQPKLVRGLSLPPSSQFCQVDDSTNSFVVNEEAVGFWHYPAEAEAETERQPIDMIAPFGNLASSAGDIALVPGGLLLLDPEAGQIQPVIRQANTWKSLKPISLPELEDPEQLRVLKANGALNIAVRDDESGHWWQRELKWAELDQSTNESLRAVQPLVETAPVASFGDAADDPGIWVNTVDPQQSLILGTDKKAGLQVYNLRGQLLQSLNIGRLNNVDVRTDIIAGNQTVNIAAASHRDTNSISLFTIDPESLEVTHRGDVSTTLDEVYGICLYQPDQSHLYAFINDKDGRVLQFEIDAAQMTGREVRSFKLTSQPEGCVADDKKQRLYIGEEDVGVWVVDAEPNSVIELQSVVEIGPQLHRDVEGIALYHRPNNEGAWLVVSSQGNNSYLVIDAYPPFTPQGAFIIGANGELGMDGASETDGLDVVSANLGGRWEQGMLVVQDGRNRMPEEAQNFKLVPWSSVQSVLKLNSEESNP